MCGTFSHNQVKNKPNVHSLRGDLNLVSDMGKVPILLLENGSLTENLKLFCLNTYSGLTSLQQDEFFKNK